MQHSVLLSGLMVFFPPLLRKLPPEPRAIIFLVPFKICLGLRVLLAGDPESKAC